LNWKIHKPETLFFALLAVILCHLTQGDTSEVSGVVSPKSWGSKTFGGPKCVILGEQQYFVWDTASQSTK